MSLDSGGIIAVASSLNSYVYLDIVGVVSAQVPLFD